MALLTEEDVRRMSDNGTRGPVVVNRGEVLTPGARDWLRAHKVEVVHPQGEAAEHAPGAPAPAKYQTLFGATLNEKPEHMTHLKGNTLVFKDHPRIAFRGWIDALEAELLLAQQAAAGEGLAALAEELGEALAFTRRFIRCDVLDEPVGPIHLCGYTAEQLRHRRACPAGGEPGPHRGPADRAGGLRRLPGRGRRRHQGRHHPGAQPAVLPAVDSHVQAQGGTLCTRLIP